jgi:hypothetical protein
MVLRAARLFLSLKDLLLDPLVSGVRGASGTAGGGVGALGEDPMHI